MQSALKQGGGRRRCSLYLATIGALFGAGVAAAADTAPVATPQNGPQTFPNVIVVHTPELAAASGTAGPAGEAPPFDPQSGGTRTTVDESQMSYTVGQKQENGQLTVFHVVGPEQAAKMVESATPSASTPPNK
ncbi:MAG TPA: hypothetical protein VKF40_17950 [Burkholderiales bacterium]|nr:hypothetical protein [Burkholderiales bacterium]